MERKRESSGINSKFETKKMGIRTHLWVTCSIFKNAVIGWTFFTLSFIFDVLGMVTNICIFYFLALFIQPVAGFAVAAFGGSFTAYVILGIVFNVYLNTSLNSFYNSLCKAYWSCAYETYATAPTGISSYLIGVILFDYMQSTISVITYILIGIFFFGLTISPIANYPIAFLLLILGTISVAGIGLIAASTFTLMNSKQWSNPVQWIVGLIVGLLSGVYFPPSILPKWAQNISYFLPQTCAYEGIRVALLVGASLENPVIQLDLIVLILACCFTIPIGILTLRYALRKGEIEGTLSRWT